MHSASSLLMRNRLSQSEILSFQAIQPLQEVQIRPQLYVVAFSLCFSDFPTVSDSTIGGYCYGAAVSISASSLATVSGCTFLNNSCSAGAGSALSGRTLGGALAYRLFDRPASGLLPQQTSVGLILEDSHFDRNRAEAHPVLASPAGGAAVGGAVAVWYSSRAQKGLTSIDNCQFIGNILRGVTSADSSGGAVGVMFDSKPPDLNTKVWNSVFKSNSVIGTDNVAGEFDSVARGGGFALVSRLVLRSHIPEFVNLTFEDNFAVSRYCSDDDECDPGGSAAGGALALVVVGIDLPDEFGGGLIHRCNFSGNWASLGRMSAEIRSTASGGAVFWGMASRPVIVRASNFTKNSVLCPSKQVGKSSPNVGGTSVCRGGAATFKDGALVEHSMFTANQAGAVGPAAGSRSSSLIVEGGAIHAETSLLLSHCTISESKAVGASMVGSFLNADFASVMITESAFRNNVGIVDSGYAAGGFYYGGAVGAIANCSFSGNALLDATTGNATGSGADVAGQFSGNSGLLNNTFSGARANLGGSIYATLQRPLAKFEENTLSNCTATAGGGAVLVALQNDSIAGEVVKLLQSTSSFRYLNNSAPYGADASSENIEIRISSAVRHGAWPSEPFSLEFGLYDILGQLTYHPDMLLTLSGTTDAPGWKSAPFIVVDRGARGIAPNATGVYRFEPVELTSPPGSHVKFVAVAQNEFGRLLAPLTVKPILVTACPPGYIPFEALDADGCRKCALGEFNLDGNSTCQPCPEGEGSSGASESCFGSPELQSSVEPGPKHLKWTIHKGFFPVPSFVEPTDLLRCPNHEACLQYNCSVRLQCILFSLFLPCSHPQ